MSRHVAIVWRGPISSCNYGCTYCPFAKARASDAERAEDEAAVERFVDWAAGRRHPLSVFFTPWGEALVHRHYHRAIRRLSSMPHVRRVAVQTNLSPRLDGLAGGDPTKVQLWATYHPDWTTQGRFLRQVAAARELSLSLSVGAVGFPDLLDHIEALRAALPDDVYLWVNAVKRLADRYTDDELARLEAIDPLFRANVRPHRSLGLPCDAGRHVVSVDGAGTVRRCHWVEDELGNLYEDELLELLAPRACPADQCRCHIGYVHLPSLGLAPLFGDGVLARIPEGWSEGRRPSLPPTAVSDATDLAAPEQAPVDQESQRERTQWERAF